MLKQCAFWIPLGFVALFVLANVVICGRMVSKGEYIRSLEHSVLTLNQEQKELETGLAQARSFQKLQVQAQLQGYLPISNVAYVKAVQSVALRP